MRLIVVLFLLSACASAHAPAGSECDPEGACWPVPLATPVVAYGIVYEPLSKIIADRRAEGLGSAYGYIELDKSPAVIHIASELTHHALICGFNRDQMIRHEIGHLNGVTRHNMVPRKSC